MPREWEVRTEDGRTWYVGSTIPGTWGEVIIPVCELADMTDEMIGATVRRLVPNAQYAGALDIAERYVSDGRANPDDNYFDWEYGYMKRFAGFADPIDKALAICEEAIASKQHRQDRSAAKARRSSGGPGYIYVLKGGPFHKIGLSKTLDQRIKTLAIQLPFQIELIFAAPVDDMFAHERRLHEMFAYKRANGEWFRLSDEDLEAVRQMYSTD